MGNTYSSQYSSCLSIFCFVLVTNKSLHAVLADIVVVVFTLYNCCMCIFDVGRLTEMVPSLMKE